MSISHCYCHLVVKEWQFHIPTDIKWSGNVNFLLLLTSSGQKWQFHISTDLLCYEWQFHTAIDIFVKEWQFHIPTDIKWSKMSISYLY